MISDARVAETKSYRDALLEHRLLVATAARGVYGFGAEFERLLHRVDALITRGGDGQEAEVIRFPSLLPRTDLEHSGYLKSFPQLVGLIHTFEGDERAHTDMLRAV